MYDNNSKTIAKHHIKPNPYPITKEDWYKLLNDDICEAVPNLQKMIEDNTNFMSPYFKFSVQIFNKVKEHFPELTNSQLLKLIRVAIRIYVYGEYMREDEWYTALRSLSSIKTSHYKFRKYIFNSKFKETLRHITYGIIVDPRRVIRIHKLSTSFQLPKERNIVGIVRELVTGKSFIKSNIVLNCPYCGNKWVYNPILNTFYCGRCHNKINYLDTIKEKKDKSFWWLRTDSWKFWKNRKPDSLLCRTDGREIDINDIRSHILIPQTKYQNAQIIYFNIYRTKRQLVYQYGIRADITKIRPCLLLLSRKIKGKINIVKYIKFPEFCLDIVQFLRKLFVSKLYYKDFFFSKAPYNLACRISMNRNISKVVSYSQGLTTSDSIQSGMVQPICREDNSCLSDERLSVNDRQEMFSNLGYLFSLSDTPICIEHDVLDNIQSNIEDRYAELSSSPYSSIHLGDIKRNVREHLSLRYSLVEIYIGKNQQKYFISFNDGFDFPVRYGLVKKREKKKFYPLKFLNRKVKKRFQYCISIRKYVRYSGEYLDYPDIKYNYIGNREDVENLKNPFCINNMFN